MVRRKKWPSSCPIELVRGTQRGVAHVVLQQVGMQFPVLLEFLSTFKWAGVGRFGSTAQPERVLDSGRMIQRHF